MRIATQHETHLFWVRSNMLGVFEHNGRIRDDRSAVDGSGIDGHRGNVMNADTRCVEANVAAAVTTAVHLAPPCGVVRQDMEHDIPAHAPMASETRSAVRSELKIYLGCTPRVEGARSSNGYSIECWPSLTHGECVTP